MFLTSPYYGDKLKIQEISSEKKRMGNQSAYANRRIWFGVFFLL